MGHWVKVSHSDPASDRLYRAGRAWYKAGDEQPPVHVDDDVLKELEADKRLRVQRASGPEDAADPHAEPLKLPQRVVAQIDPVARLEQLRKENEALKAQDEIARLEKENAELRARKPAVIPSAAPSNEAKASGASKR